MGKEIFGNRGGGPALTSNKDIIPEKESSLSAIYSSSTKELNYKGTTTINFPSGSNQVYSIRKTNKSSWSPVIADELIVDRDGTVLHREIFSEKPVNVQIASLIKPIHTGQIYGTFSKILYFLACLIATSLPITGTLIWLNKMKKRPMKSAQKEK